MLFSSNGMVRAATVPRIVLRAMVMLPAGAPAPADSAGAVSEPASTALSQIVTSTSGLTSTAPHRLWSMTRVPLTAADGPVGTAAYRAVLQPDGERAGAEDGERSADPQPPQRHAGVRRCR